MADDEVIIEIRAEVAGLKKELSKANTLLNKFVKDTEKKNKEAKNSFLDVKSAISTAFGVSFSNVLQKAATALTDFSKQGISDFLTYEQQLQGLKIQVGDFAEVLLTDLRSATKGMVSDINLITGANRALALGIEKESLPALAKTATALGKIQGLSPEQAFNDIVTGIGRASPMILDNLGIVLKASDGYTDLSDKVALTNAVIEKASKTVEAFEGIGETHKDSLDRMSAGWDNLKKSVGGELVKTFDDLVFLLKSTEEQIVEVSSELKAQDKLLSDIQSSWNDVTTEISELNKELDGYQERLKKITGEETQKEVEAQRELNKLNLEELKIKQAVKETSGGGIEIIDKEKYNQLLEEGVVITSDVFDKIQARKEELKLEIELEEALKQVEFDRGIIQAENQELMAKNENSVKKISEAVSAELKSLKETNLKLIDKHALENDIVDMALEEKNYRKELETSIRNENKELSKKVDLQKQYLALTYAASTGNIGGISSSLKKINKQLKVENPSSFNLPSSSSQAAPGTIYNFVIENVNGTDPDDMAAALQERLEIIT